jgi:hypothetical protein
LKLLFSRSAQAGQRCPHLQSGAYQSGRDWL